MVQGEYAAALYDLENLKTVLQFSENEQRPVSDAYHSVMIRNDAIGIIKNNNALQNTDKKILILQDSFSWYSTTYLACGVGEVHIIHPKAFDGSIKTYVEELKPDVVLTMYYAGNIEPVDWTTHTSMFDFR